MASDIEAVYSAGVDGSGVEKASRGGSLKNLLHTLRETSVRYSRTVIQSPYNIIIDEFIVPQNVLANKYNCYKFAFGPDGRLVKLFTSPTDFNSLEDIK